MSAELIRRLAECGAFEPAVSFDDLIECHVDFDELVGDRHREAALARLLTRERPVKIAISGPSGSGKSSLVAASLANLPGHLPLPIAIAQADIEILTSQTRFGQFILREIDRQAREGFGLQDRIRSRRSLRRVRSAAADRTTRSAGGIRLRGDVKAPIPVPGAPSLAEIAGEVTTAVKAMVDLANPSTSLTGISEVMRLFAPTRMPTPVLVIDDADKWASTHDPEQVDQRAEALFTTALQPLLAANFHLVVAVQDHWPRLPTYDNLDKLLTETIEIPEFAPDATPALRRIIAWRAQLDADGGDSVDDLLDASALARLEAEYDHANRNLRRVLRVLDRAVKSATLLPAPPARLDHIMIRDAARP